MANYIHTLQNEVKVKENTIKAYENGLNELVAYLLSPKFHSGDTLDSYVNITDVMTRVQGIRSSASDAEMGIVQEAEPDSVDRADYHYSEMLGF